MPNHTPNTMGLRPFPKGHKYGGNPLAGKREKLRSALSRAVTAKDIERIAKRLVSDAIAGDVPAAHELLDRVLGKADQAIVGHDGGAVKVEVQQRIMVELAKCTEEYERIARERSAEAVSPNRN